MSVFSAGRGPGRTRRKTTAASCVVRGRGPRGDGRRREERNMDVREQVMDLARRAKAAARTMAAADGSSKVAAIQALAWLLNEEREAIKEANAKDLDAAKAGGHGLRAPGPPGPHGQGHRFHDRGLPRGGRPGRPRGRDRAHVAASQRPARGAHAHPAGRHRHDLRVAAQRHRGFGHPLPHGGQRRDPARRVRGFPFQPFSGLAGAQGPGRRGAAARRRAGGAPPPSARPWP